MFSPIDTLIGRRFTASIGEPWDFVSSIGKNLLEGEICDISFSVNNQPCLLCNVSCFDNLGNCITQVLAVNRYIDSQDLFKALSSKQGATVNFVYINSINKMSSAKEFMLNIDSTKVNFLVGTMHLLSNQNKGVSP